MVLLLCLSVCVCVSTVKPRNLFISRVHVVRPVVTNNNKNKKSATSTEWEMQIVIVDVLTKQTPQKRIHAMSMPALNAQKCWSAKNWEFV